ncbi:MAG: hypothetical protein A2017_07130 [Lentisphaerae bacterium GWF2_44_16]|nr:MAG: hypothetical protein A2017_07130 [Lentisphaerae bacterium GWF2_44_16]
MNGYTFKRRFHFTLIELLIVVSVIVILIGILLPALQKAKQEAHKIVCKNNLRQIGFMVVEYVNDNNGTMCPYVALSPTRYWPVCFQDYLAAIAPKWRLSAMNGISTEDGTGIWDRKTWGPLSCPSAPTSGTSETNLNNMDYGINTYIGWCGSSVQDASTAQKYYRFHNITRSSEVFIFADVAWPIYRLLPGSQTLRHNGGFNLLYCDSHVGWNKGYISATVNNILPWNSY